MKVTTTISTIGAFALHFLATAHAVDLPQANGVVTVVSSEQTTAATNTAQGKVLFSFEDSDSAQAWTAVNDGVMGGISEGDGKWTEAGTLLFSGKLSLENNGGFSSIRSKPRALNLSGSDGIVINAKGDGRTYWVDLRITKQMSASSYRAYLPTVAGENKAVVIPLSDFKLQAFGRELSSSPIALADVESIGFTIADKKAGPFRLELISISTQVADQAATSSKTEKTIVDVAKEAGSFKTLLAAAGAADLAGALSGDGPLTVFAPTDEAFAKLPKGTVDELLKPENREQLVAILKFHVVAGRVNLSKALEVGEAITLQGGVIRAKFSDGKVRIGSATLLQADITASNGIIHVIDQVLLPPITVAKPLTTSALLELAIERGVPLFNDGNHSACAALYEVTCEAVRAMPDVAKKSREELSLALTEMRAEKNELQQAWILRKAMDSVYARFSE